MTKLVDLELKPELEPCPFATPTSHLVSLWSDIDGKIYQVECTCGATGPMGFSRDEVIAAWNRRAPVTSQEMEI